MYEALRSHGRLFVGLCSTAAIALVLVLGYAPASANAWSLSPFCGNQTLSGYEICEGAPRTLYGVYGWGEQHSVCVYARGWPIGSANGYTCSSGPSQGVVVNLNNSYYAKPGIQNNASGNTRVQGEAFQP